MKRVQRINRVTRKRPPRGRGKLLPIVLITTALALLLQVVVVVAAVTTSGVGALSYYNRVSAAGLTKLKNAPVLQDVQPTRILDRHGRLLLQISTQGGDLHRDVPLLSTPRYMREAIIASENASFYRDHGVDPRGIGRALYDAAKSRGSFTAGGSTITQQLVKQLVLGSQRTAQRKLQEILISYAVGDPHSGFSKDKILQLYLNTVFFGHQAYGVEAAAKVYFGRDIWQLDLAQCAFLAGLVQEPTYLDPLGVYGSVHDQNGLLPGVEREDLHVLPRMVVNTFITQAQADAAMAEARRFSFTEPKWRPTTSQSAAPYWTDWVRHVLNYGSPDDPSWDRQLAAIVDRAGGLSSGLTITTTLDLNMYQRSEQIMNQRVSELSTQNVNDAAVVTLDPHTAECLAMVGGLDYYSSATGSQLNMAVQRRQPGSSFKVFTYLTAFEHGWYPSKMILDEPKTWPDSGSPGGIYAPQNYDKSWHGAVTVRMALANSYNIPAVKTIDAVGVKPVIRTAVDMGVWALRGLKSAGLSLTLGSKEVPLWQMAQAYNVFANGGVFRPMASILAVSNAQGATLYTYRPPLGVQVVAPQFAYLINSILKDNYARVPAFNTNSVLQLGPDSAFSVNRPAAVKTGTSQYFRDNLTIGYTPNLLTATWVGNPDGSPMINVEGVDGAGPIWHDVMEWSLQHLNLPVQDFTPPPGVMLERVSSSGYLASGATAWPITDVFAAGAIPHQYDPGYGENYTAYRVLPYNFSLDGGTTSSLFTTAMPITSTGVTGMPGVAGTISITGTTGISTTAPGGPNGANGPNGPNAGYTNAGSANGSGGTITYNPGSSANICPGGGRYTYMPITSNGQTVYRYTCQ